MFDATLLDSSPSRAPVLAPVHWLISLGVGVVGFFAAYFALPLVFAGLETKVLAVQSSFVGAAFLFFALMLCYVWADTKHLRLSVWFWLAVTVLFNLIGFLLYLIYSAAKTDNWKRATIPIAYVCEILLVGVLVLIPLIYTQALPKAQLMTFLVAPPPPPPPPPPPAASAPVRVVHRVTAEDLMKAPTVIPKTVKMVKEEPEPPSGAVGVVGGVPGGVPGGTAGGVIGGVIGGVLSSAPPPPPPKAAPQRIKVGGRVEEALQIFAPKPEYPQLARMARIAGMVRLHAFIAKDGTIQNLTVLGGHPLLVKSAIEAVSRWRYKPYLLNAEPVEVETEIDVNFTLSE